MQTETKQKMVYTTRGNAIFVRAWGYSMILVDFFEVIQQTPKTVTLRKLNSQETPTGFLSGEALPTEEWATARRGLYKDVRAFKREENGETVYVANDGGVRMRYHVWDGKPKYFDYCD